MLLLKRLGKSGNRGFTLVELMVVIAIIAVLAAIAIPVFSRTRENARQTRCTANLHAIAIALRSYMIDYNGFPLPYNPAAGTGGVTQLYLEGYLTSPRVLRCPDDVTTLQDYRTANGLTADSRWNDTNGPELFADRYSSYNQLLFPNAATPVAYPLYNYYGYRGHANCTGTSSNGNFTFNSSLFGTGPSAAEVAALGGAVWASRVYRDSTHKYYHGASTRIFDRAPTDTYARPLWDVDMGNITAYFPGLVNRNAPDNTIVTHCPHHRTWFGNDVSTQKDLIVRLAGDTDKLGLGNYDWVVQKQAAE